MVRSNSPPIGAQAYHSIAAIFVAVLGAAAEADTPRDGPTVSRADKIQYPRIEAGVGEGKHTTKPTEKVKHSNLAVVHVENVFIVGLKVKAEDTGW